MFIDCETCSVRGAGCGECVVTVLLGVPSVSGAAEPVELDGAERTALAVLAGSGLVPPLRLTPVASQDQAPGHGESAAVRRSQRAGGRSPGERQARERRRAG